MYAILFILLSANRYIYLNVLANDNDDAEPDEGIIEPNEGILEANVHQADNIVDEGSDPSGINGDVDQSSDRAGSGSSRSPSHGGEAELENTASSNDLRVSITICTCMHM